MTNLDELSRIISELTAPEEVKKFLDEILTDKERKDIVLRWELMKRLNSGVPQRSIAADLKISLCKITRGSKILKAEDSVSAKILNSQE